jgi:alpha-tubulin suppressor-like RCC1 family protein
MLRKIFHTAIAVSIAATPLSASAADRYYFRFAAPESLNISIPPVDPGDDDVEYGVGNDIVAEFVAASGYDFSKRIPVATQDVVSWVKDSGAVPTGLQLDVSAGVFHGRPGQPTGSPFVALYHGFDAAGHKIARAEIHFTVFDPVGPSVSLDYYSHVGTYFYANVPNPQGATVFSWEPVSALPDGMTLINSSLQGTPTKAGAYDVGLRGYDYLGREIAFAIGSFLVEAGPKVEQLMGDGAISSTFADQSVDKAVNESFSITPTVRHALGPVTYRLVPATARPAGVTFSSATGALKGVYDDFDTSAAFRIEARDSYDGTVGISNSFKLTTLPARLDLSAMPDLSGTVGIGYFRKLTSPSVVAGATWSILQGSLPESLKLDQINGTISGVPTKTEIQSGIVIGVSGPGMTPAQSSPFAFQVYGESIAATLTDKHIRVGVPFETAGITVTSGGSEGYTVSTSSLPAGTTINPTTGVISAPEGVAVAGNYDQQIKVTTPGRETSFGQVLRVYNPLKPTYGDQTVVRHESIGIYPTNAEDSVAGAVRYALNAVDGGAIPSWIDFSSSTGRLVASPENKSLADKTFGPFVVTATDTLNSGASEPFSVQVSERAAIKVPLDNKGVQRFVPNYYWFAGHDNTYGTYKYEFANAPQGFPSTLSISQYGYLQGTTDDAVGTIYSGLQVKVTDSEGFVGLSDPFNLVVRAPDALSGLAGSLDKSIEWTAGQAFSLSLPALSNGYGKSTYAFDTSVSGVTLSDATVGTVDGSISTVGTYQVPFTVGDETARSPAHGILTVKINPQPELAPGGDVLANRATALSEAVPVVTGGTAPLSFNLAGVLPRGMSYTNGILSGAPEQEGEFPLSVTVTDAAGAQRQVGFSLKVGAPLPLALTYGEDTPMPEYGRYGYVIPTLTNILNKTSPITWTSSGAMPSGMNLNTTNGQIVGVPSQTGWFRGVKITATEIEGRSATAEFDIFVTRFGQISFDTKEFKHRRATPFIDRIVTSNGVDPVKYVSADADGIPYGLILNGDTGTISGSFPAAGSYVVPVTAYDLADRRMTQDIAYLIVDDLVANAGDVVLDRYVPSSAAAPVVQNAIGTVTFTQKSGTLPAGLSISPTTGAVVGASDEAGSYPGIVVEAKDVDGTTAQAGPFTVIVNERAQLVMTGSDQIEFRRYDQGTAAYSTTSAIGTVTWSIAPALPTGVSFDKNTGSISGTSDVKVDAASYTLTAVDSKGGALGTATKQVTFSVRERDQIAISGSDSLTFTQFAAASASFASTYGIGQVVWSVSPALPAGITLNASSGVISGISDVKVDAASYTLTAVDSKGGPLGTATKVVSIGVDARAALAVGDVDPQGFVQYQPGKITLASTSAIGAVNWSVSPALPSGLVIDATTGAIAGTPVAKQDAADYVVTAADSKGGELGTARTTVSIAVAERLPLTITNAEQQTALLGNSYTLALSADNVVGAVAWSVTSGTPPTGISFDAGTGTFSGTPSVYAEVATVVVHASDLFGGSADRTFTFAVKQDGSPMTLTASGSTTRVGQAFAIPLPVAANTVGDTTFSLASGTTGLSINAKTGKISGTPTTTFTENVTVSIKDSTDRLPVSSTITVVSVPKIVVTAPSSVALTYNYVAPAEAAVAAAQTVGAVTWSVSGVLPKGVGFNTSTGGFTGTPTEIGTFGPIYVTAADTLSGATKSSAISLKVEMNADPISLAVTDFATKVGYPVLTALPTYGNTLGAATFFSNDLAGTGLAISPQTGVLSGTAQALADQYLNLSVRDAGTSRVTSKPLHYQVLPTMQITVPSQVSMAALTDASPVSPTRTYVIGGATWDELDQSVHKLPEGVVFDVSTGTLKGNPQEIGSFGPFTISSVDSLGDRGTSNSFTIKVNPGATFVGLAATTLPDATKRTTAYSYDFKQNLTYVGMDESELTWALGSGNPPGLTLVNGILSGTPSKSGTYSFEVSASYGGVIAKRTYSLVVNLPQIDLQLAGATLANAKRAVSGVDNGYASDLKTAATLKNITASSVKYALEPAVAGESFPAGLAVSSSGVISGTATGAAGIHTFRVTASFADGTDETISSTATFSIQVVDPVNIAFNAASFSAASKRLAYDFDLGSLLDEQVLAGVTKAQIAWSWAAASGSSLPAGLTITAGRVTGTPTNSGTFNLVVTASFDGRTVSKTISLNIGLQAIALAFSGGEGAMVDGARKQSYSFNASSDIVTLTNIQQSDLKWSVQDVAVTGSTYAGLPAGMGINATTGLISGTPTVGGQFKFAVKATYDDANATAEHIEATKTYALTIAGGELKFSQIKEGRMSACGLTTAGGVVCWGDNAYGQLGNGSNTASTTPVTPTGLSSGVVSLSVGQYHACAVLGGGGVRCWGANDVGQLGNGLRVNSNAPVTVASISNAKTIESGLNANCVVDAVGGLKCWGANGSAELGIGNTTTPQLAPVSPTGLTSGVSQVALGSGGATCAVLTSGAARCWGANGNSQVGNGGASGNVTTPTVPTGLTSGVKQISVGYNHTCATLTAGGVRCWGYNDVGQLGINSTTRQNTPVALPLLTTSVTQVDAGYGYTCVVMTAGGVKCFGSNENGRLGDGTQNKAIAPVDSTRFDGLGIKQIATDRYFYADGFTCGISGSDTGMCLGNNSYGQLGNSSVAKPGSSFSAVQVGD